MKSTKQVYAETNGVSEQRNADSVQKGLSPQGSAVLYMVSADKDLTPNTSGHTSSSNQLTTSGK